MKNRTKLYNIIALLIAVSLGVACTHNPERIVIEKEKLFIPEFDPDAFDCPDKPKLTDEQINSPDFTERDVSLYVLELARRGDICSSKLEGVENQIDEARETIKERQSEK